MKKELKSLLNTKIRDLTPEVLAQLEKKLGTSDRPFPMWGSQRIEGKNGEITIDQNLSVIADDDHPMKVYSDRSYKEVIALAYCDMPVPSMLPLFFDGLERRKPDSTNRTQMMIGNPGHGKSFLGALQGRMRSRAPVEVFDCGGKNMNELLFEMVLDFGAGEALPSAIDKRLKAGTLQALSQGKLKNLPGDAVSVDAAGNIQSIDWNYFRGSAKPEEVEKAFQAMKEVSQIEKLDEGGGNALGMNSQYGPLIRWFLEGREGVLDEYNKSREGSDNALQTVWQFLIGEISTCTVENPLKNKDTTSGPSSFTFRREDMQTGFFVTLTGNKVEDGVTTRSLNKSVYSRLSPQTLPDPEVQDWQHRICQMIVGVPVSTLYTAYKEKADKNPAAFGEWLLYLRRAKADIEGTPVPALQEELLHNWRNVLQASESLAMFYNDWSEMTDAEKVMQKYTSLIDEVDEEYSKKEGIDFRKIKQHLEEAVPIRPRMQAYDVPVSIVFGNWDKPPVTGEAGVAENTSLAFGTRLVEFLERMVYEKSGAIDKPKLYKLLCKSMESNGLRDISLTEGTRSSRKSVEENLNVNSFADHDFGKQAKIARKVFCDYIRQVDPEVIAEDDQIVTIKKLRDALEFVSQKDTAATKELFVVNRDHETLGSQPLTAIRIEDVAVHVAQDRETEVCLDDLVHHDDFMASLALPTVGSKNISAIWETNLRVLSKDDPKTAPSNQNTPLPAAVGAKSLDEATFVAEGTSGTGLATTTLRVAFGNADDMRDVSIHIVKNSLSNKTLVVGESLPSRLVSAFKEAGVTYIDRNDRNAEAKTEAALNALTRRTGYKSQAGTAPQDTSKYGSLPAPVQAAHLDLENAFKYRNRVAAGDRRNIAELLVDKESRMIYDKFLVKGSKKAM